MNWSIQYLPEVEKDINGLSPKRQKLVRKAIEKASQPPLPQNEGGYGKPLGNQRGMNLTNLLKLKLRGEGLRIIYKLVRTETQMLVVVVGVREDEEVYRTAYSRKRKYNL